VNPDQRITVHVVGKREGIDDGRGWFVDIEGQMYDRRVIGLSLDGEFHSTKAKPSQAILRVFPDLPNVKRKLPIEFGCGILGVTVCT